eukprot:363683-Chlamydomonas_euryale.AAC.3
MPRVQTASRTKHPWKGEACGVGRCKLAARSLGAHGNAQKPINQAQPPWTLKVGARPIWWKKPRAETDRPPRGPASR